MSEFNMNSSSSSSSSSSSEVVNAVVTAGDAIIIPTTSVLSSSNCDDNVNSKNSNHKITNTTTNNNNNNNITATSSSDVTIRDDHQVGEAVDLDQDDSPSIIDSIIMNSSSSNIASGGGGGGGGLVEDIVEDTVVDQFDSLTIYGNKSLNELHEIQSKKSHLSAGILFTDPALGIPTPILESLTLEMRFEKPSEIQASTLPLILGGHHVIAQAQSGAGKTIAFVIGMLSRINPNLPQPQALCLTPTRELAVQIVNDAVKPLSSRLPYITYELALPGKDISGGRCTSHIVVGTPGTILKTWLHPKTNYLDLRYVNIFVLDEADKMVDDMQLGAETLKIKAMLNPLVQILFFSATYSKKIMTYARKIVPKAYLVTPRSDEELVLDVIFQVRMDVRKCLGGKLKVLQDIYEFMTVQQSIVFCEMKEEANRIEKMMTDENFEVSKLHGGLLPEQRDQVMSDFREGRTKVLITTNVLARGVDIPAVGVVVNYDIPVERQGQKVVADEATYLHRIGRCGRFGRRGTAINFLERETDFKHLEDIEKYYSPNKRMTTEWDPNDIEGLSQRVACLPTGGEIDLLAKKGASGFNGVTIPEMK